MLALEWVQRLRRHAGRSLHETAAAVFIIISLSVFLFSKDSLRLGGLV